MVEQTLDKRQVAGSIPAVTTNIRLLRRSTRMSSMNTKSVGYSLVIIFLALFIGLPLSVWLGATVLQDLWTWFIVPLGLPVVTKVHAYGLALAIGIFTGTPAVIAKLTMNFESKKYEWAIGTLTYLFAWGMGALIHNYM